MNRRIVKIFIGSKQKSVPAGSGEISPAQSVDLLHEFEDLLLHALAGFAFTGELHQADLLLFVAEIDLPAFFGTSHADPVLMVAAFKAVYIGGDQVLFEEFL